MRVTVFFAAAVLSALAWAPRGLGDQDSKLGLETPHPIVFAQRYVVASEALGESRQVDVRLPASYAQSAVSRTYPVVFVLDGELLFEPVAAVVGHLSSVGRIPEAIVVGLPNHTGDRLGMSPKFLNRDGKPSGFGGREEAYLQFFQEELLPFLGAEFRAADFRILFGVSPTAAFALHSFWQAPDLFQAHVAMVAGTSPGKKYSTGETLTEAMEASLRQRPDRKAWLYLSSAASNFETREEIRTSLKAFESRLQPFLSKGLSFRSEVVPGAAYATALPAITSALDLIFPAKEWDPRYMSFLEGEEPALANLEAHFGALSERYGFSVVPLGDRFFNVNCLRGLASRLRRQGRTEEAVQVLRRWVELYSSDPQPYFYLAFALKAAEEPGEALAVGKKGLEIARELSSPDLAEYEEHFRQLEESFEAGAGETPASP